MGTRISGLELRAVLLLGLAYGFAFFDRNTMYYLSPFVATALKLTNLQIGMLGAGLSVTWAGSAFLVARWSDRIGRRKPFLLGMLAVFSLASVLSGMATSFPMLLGARMIMGAAEGPFLPICLAVVASVSAPRRQGLNSGIVQGGFGSLMGNALAPLVVVAMAVAWGWRSAFFLAGLPGLILALLVLLLIPETGSGRPEQKAERAGGTSSMLALLRVRNVWLCAAICATMIGSLVIGSIFFPLYFVRVRGYTPEQMGTVMAILGLCPAIGGVAVPWISDRIGRRGPIVVCAVLTALTPLAAIWLDASLPVLTAVMFALWLSSNTSPIFMGVLPAASVRRADAATAIGIVIAIGELSGGVFGPLVGGWGADLSGLRVPLLVQAGLALASAALALGLREPPRRDDEEPSAGGTPHG